MFFVFILKRTSVEQNLMVYNKHEKEYRIYVFMRTGIFILGSIGIPRW